MLLVLCIHTALQSFFTMAQLEQFGWNTFHQENFNKYQNTDLFAGRVLSIRGFKYYLITETGELEAELSGKLLYSNDTEDLPKVGDWVSYLDYGETGYIIDVMPRTNMLARKTPGNRNEKQVLAANVDYAFIVQGLDRDFNIMRLERYLTQVITCHVTPVVILNKADLVEDTTPYQEQVLKLKRDVQTIFCSTMTGLGIYDLKNSLQARKTYLMIGSSGVGKSSLMNKLIDKRLQKTSSTSDANNKGRHTTTTRDLILLDNGSLLIDTPGMREFGLTEGDETSEAMFPVINEFSKQCRYNDCKHINESGCGVLRGVEQGEIDIRIYESYVKLLKEQKRFEVNAEDKKRLNKQFGKMTKEAKNHRKRFKY
jgi:ribosome biogenesis GTPase / thiamine phosphate phosphatase